MNGSMLRRALVAASVSLALACGLAGCATGPDTAEAEATAYRAQVVAIADASAAGNYAEALGKLEALEAELDAAAADGTLTDEREQRIRDAIALVRADLEAAIAAAVTPEPVPTEEAGDDSSGPGNSGENAKPGKGEGKGKGKGKD
ncbi:hypothetical protein ACFPER_04095 [Agromyces aurantiacus]|uniref:Mucin-associated surface protein n=1 Tax=Agromyces aurantiacus TaxID=165814 RepID=A0ABV9R1W7_9MICO|nr:hypothetical protein [Agromyces aurantiacus]MBM7502637.1 negative regulator of sigma E activity [Agromyces aurantiacus]